MTYAERIERVTQALAGVSDEEWARTRAETKEYFREQARAADAAVLEAIREPTEEMSKRCAGYYGLPSGKVTGAVRWTEAHAAIPRGEGG